MSHPPQPAGDTEAISPSSTQAPLRAVARQSLHSSAQQPIDQLRELNRVIESCVASIPITPGSIFFYRKDKTRGLAAFLAFADSPGDAVRLMKNDQPSPLAFSRVFTWTDQQERTFHVRLIWAPFSTDSTFSACYNKKRITIGFRGTCRNKLSGRSIASSPAACPLPLKKRFAALFSKLPCIKKAFRGSWLLADRDFKADDNAEHLYRWMMRNHPEQRCFFALRKDSPDWARLTAEGFRLINLKSLRFFFAFLYCDWFLSSSKSGGITKPRWRQQYAGLIRHRFGCLKHGVTKDYQPLLNCSFMDMLVTVAEPEHHAFAEAPEYAYVFSNREVRLTGFPRYDALLKKAEAVKKPGTILLMPTWRKSLVGDTGGKLGQRPYSDDFRHSIFFKQWQALISSRELQHAAGQYGYTVRFYPHPGLRRQMQDFNFGSIAPVSDLGGGIQDILADTALLVTDYSSIAMDAALLGRAVLYFQFDRDTFFKTDHSYAKGYFDYDTDGFGETAQGLQSAVSLIRAYLSRGCVMPERFRQRAESFFAFRDQGNCQRVYEALLDSKPQ